jgi:hypothetical protein
MSGAGDGECVASTSITLTGGHVANRKIFRVMEQFASECAEQTPPMTVTVTDRVGQFMRRYDTPAGFQLERNVASLYPGTVLEISFPSEAGGRAFQADVCDEHGALIKTHCGRYH